MRHALKLLVFDIESSAEVCLPGSLATITLSSILGGLFSAVAALNSHQFRVLIPSAVLSRIVSFRRAVPSVVRDSLRIGLLAAAFSVLISFVLAGWSSVGAVAVAGVHAATTAALLQLSAAMVRAVYAAPVSVLLLPTPQPGALALAALQSTDPMLKVRHPS